MQEREVKLASSKQKIRNARTVITKFELIKQLELVFLVN